MSNRFVDKVVIVTGAAQGLGRATATAFAREGASVCLVDINGQALDGVRTELAAANSPVLALDGDLSDPGFCRTVVARAVAHFGRLDVLCNIAGVVQLHHVADVTEAAFQRILAVNLAAPFWLSQAAIPHLLETGGNIVNCGSQSALKGAAYLVPYSMTKAGIVQMTRSLAMEYVHQPIRINAVCPGTMGGTNMEATFAFPEGASMELFARIGGLRPLLDPGDVASMFLYVASDDARGVHGAVLTVDGGCTAD